jgi:hypothetical protein
MKTLIVALAICLTMASCGSTGSSNDLTVDSTTTVSVTDTTHVQADTTRAVDSASR